MLLYNVLYVLGESIISIYPILIKLTTMDIPFNSFIRMVSYFIISALFANLQVVQSIGVFKLLSLAVVNIAHILSSYYGFRALNPSLAESIFYIYPFITILLNILVLNETISYTKFAFLIPVIYCIFNIYKDNEIENSQQNFSLGIPMLIIAAITESLLYIIIKSVDMGANPWNNLFASYALGAILYGIYYIKQTGVGNLIDKIKTNKKEVSILVLANMLIGSFGYGVRFWAIPRIPSVTYSMFSYTGIFSTVALAFLLKLEKVSMTKIVYLLGLAVSIITMKLI